MTYLEELQVRQAAIDVALNRAPTPIGSAYRPSARFEPMPVGPWSDPVTIWSKVKSLRASAATAAERRELKLLREAFLLADMMRASPSPGRIEPTPFTFTMRLKSRR